MGRGRAKAKQTRVARDLKYRTFSTDFTSLERELRGDSTDTPFEEVVDDVDDDEDEDDEYADYADRYAADDEDDDDLGRRIG
ncbi:MAG TPA: DUF3073 domain-containing protein [Propioniciclava tarda]|nr:DUF3073 domain-containing protein [Propioniciclava tarda]HQA31586.1 DUF3073 domain-containing protein [Propioniciclava tarda]HQD61766.1 DUF3073 domain-containing protein [Propioniciclava tarda]